MWGSRWRDCRGLLPTGRSPRVGEAGFPGEALIFFDGLEADNSKAYWTDHRETYERAVRAPMLALLGALELEFGEPHVSRPYRDIRFSKDNPRARRRSGRAATGVAMSSCRRRG
jgi:uncharacterized protein (DUF2461 family)